MLVAGCSPRSTFQYNAVLEPNTLVGLAQFWCRALWYGKAMQSTPGHWAGGTCRPRQRHTIALRPTCSPAVAVSRQSPRPASASVCTPQWGHWAASADCRRFPRDLPFTSRMRCSIQLSLEILNCGNDEAVDLVWASLYLYSIFALLCNIETLRLLLFAAISGQCHDTAFWVLWRTGWYKSRKEGGFVLLCIVCARDFRSDWNGNGKTNAYRLIQYVTYLPILKKHFWHLFYVLFYIVN